jgi:hypothetical protein
MTIFGHPTIALHPVAFRSFMIRLDFDEVKGLFLAERRGGLARFRPVADGERRACAFGAEDLPIIGVPPLFICSPNLKIC